MRRIDINEDTCRIIERIRLIMEEKIYKLSDDTIIHLSLEKELKLLESLKGDVKEL